MDKIYVGDIPLDFKYALFGSNYIELFNTQNLNNGTFQYYRIYLYDNLFEYDTGYRNYNQYSSTVATPVEVTDNIRYRRDFPQILTSVFIYCILFVFLINLVTSSIKRNGMLGGLL